MGIEIDPGDPDCTAGLAGAIWDQWTTDPARGFVDPLTSDMEAMIKAQVWSFAAAIADAAAVADVELGDPLVIDLVGTINEGRQALVIRFNGGSPVASFFVQGGGMAAQFGSYYGVSVNSVSLFQHGLIGQGGSQSVDIVQTIAGRPTRIRTNTTTGQTGVIIGTNQAVVGVGEAGAASTQILLKVTTGLLGPDETHGTSHLEFRGDGTLEILNTDRPGVLPKVYTTAGMPAADQGWRGKEIRVKDAGADEKFYKCIQTAAGGYGWKLVTLV